MKKKIYCFLLPKGCETCSPHLNHSLRERCRAQESLDDLHLRVQPCNPECRQGGNGYHFHCLWYDQAEDQTHKLPVSGRPIYHETTDKIHL